MSTAPATISWHEANQRYLTAALAVVRAALDRHAARAEGQAEAPPSAPANDVRDELRQAADALPSPSALDTVCSAFGLSPFERDVLLLCAGVELDSSFAAHCARAQGDPRRTYPTFSLALAALPDAHWSALTPAVPLRHWRLIEVGTGETLTTAPLRIDERVLHYLAGVSYLDQRLEGLVEPVPVPEELPPAHQEVADRIIDLWCPGESVQTCPVVQLCGDDSAGKRAVAASGCAELGLHLHALRVAALPTTAAERQAFTRLWEREAVLAGSALLLECDGVDSAESSRAVLPFVENFQNLLLLSCREPLDCGRRSAVRLDVGKPTFAEQRALWQTALGPLAAELNGQIEILAAQFSLGAAAIHTASAELQHYPPGDRELSAVLWRVCRAQARPRLESLAQRIEPVATWDDLVLPDAQRHLLREIAAQVRQRFTVYETWGFAAKSSRGLGISAVFVGDSGTGKTMAAEVLANELRLDVYRIDLSQVVSKYIGETEKNLRRVFDAAEEGGAILLFDEADALFGKRSEVKDSHDRYANIEVSYLLQRMEAYRGLAILTTNLRNALDTAFLRRIRFVVYFPFPDVAHRAEIWRRIFPADTPTLSLDVTKLARLNVAGGNIRNIALNASFLAADEGVSVTMRHLQRAARSECAKIEKPLSEAEVRGWV